MRRTLPKLIFSCLCASFFSSAVSAEEKKDPNRDACKKEFKLSDRDSATLKKVNEAGYNIKEHVQEVDAYASHFVPLRDKAKTVGCHVFTNDGHEARYIYFIELY